MTSKKDSSQNTFSLCYKNPTTNNNTSNDLISWKSPIFHKLALNHLNYVRTFHVIYLVNFTFITEPKEQISGGQFLLPLMF